MKKRIGALVAIAAVAISIIAQATPASATVNWGCKSCGNSATQGSRWK
jgi:hypothetical protein